MTHRHPPMEAPPPRSHHQHQPSHPQLPPPPHPVNGHHAPPPSSTQPPPSSSHPRQLPPQQQQQQQNGVVSPPGAPQRVVPRSALPAQMPPQMSQSLLMLSEANEATWNLIGNLAEQMNDPDRAESAYEHALRHNPESERALTQVASIARSREDFAKAIEFFQRALDVRQENGEVWSALGHCYLMQDDLQKAYTAYQQALYHLPNPKDPKLWYGIGILYDRYGSLDNAEEAFASVMRMDSKFEKAEEILFRLGIIYKQQQKYPESLDCFDRILRNPPAPLANLDIWFQIGHVYEQAKNFEQAKEAYERVLAESPNHAKVLQQLGWLYHQPGSSFTNQDMAINCLTKGLEADPGDAQSWYLLGRAFMTVQKYQKAYEAYQQAVYRDGRNPTFWCSIGVLYYNINQYRDALDAYSRAIRINPYIPEVWFDLGSLYESCNNQIGDAIDAYTRAADLDPNNQSIKARLRMLKEVQSTGGTMPAAPGPQDVHPTAYASAHGPPSMIGNGPSLGTAPSSHHSRQPLVDSRSNSRTGLDHPMNGGATRDLPAPSPSMRAGRTSADAYRHGDMSQEPFRGGPPPPLNLDENMPRRGSASHAALAPMDVDRPPLHHGGYPEPPRTGGSGPSAVTQQPPPLHHPVPQPPLQSIPDIQTSGPPHPSHSLPPMGRGGPPYDHPDPRRMSPPSESPRGSGRRPNTKSAPSPAPPPFHQSTSYPPPSRTSYTPAATQGLPPPITSAHHGLPYDRGTATSTAHSERHDPPWERRHNRHDSRNGSMEQMPPGANGQQQSSNGYRSDGPGGRLENVPPGAYGSGGPPNSAQHAQHSPPAGRAVYDRRMRSPGPGGPPAPRGQQPRDPSADRADARSPYPQSSYPPTWSGPAPPSGNHHSPPSGSVRRPRSPGLPKRYDPVFDGDQPRPREVAWDRDAPTPQPQPPHHAQQQQHPDRSANATPEMTGPGPRAVRPHPATWRKESESPRPGSTRATVEPPKERKRKGAKVDKDGEGSATPKAPKEKKERKAPTKRGAAAKLQQQPTTSEKDEVLATASTTASPPVSTASQFRTASQWAAPGPPSQSATPRPAQGHRISRSVDEDYDDEAPEVDRSDNQNNAAAALIDLAGSRDRDASAAPPPAPLRSGSSGRIESLLNGPLADRPPSARPSRDHERSPVSQQVGAKRLASEEHTDAGARKRTRVEDKQISANSVSPLAAASLPSLSPVNNGMHTAQSRRTSMDISSRSGSHSRRSWGADGMEQGRGASPVLNGSRSSISPNTLPPISTLPSDPTSPSVDRRHTPSGGSVASPHDSRLPSPTPLHA
ncbi:glucose repression mediator protein [Tulasnella sp. JGI-2019a]|nr:glucose repression mediator protein [Tulasnella sp. JGI-2019a]